MSTKRVPALYHKTYSLRPTLEGEVVMRGPVLESEVAAPIRKLLNKPGVDAIIVMTHAEHDIAETRAIIYRKMAST